MNKHFLTLSLLLSGSFCFAQDTVYVSDQYKSYLLFDEAVSLADVGNPLSFQAHIEDQTIMLVARDTSLLPTPFYAVAGGKAFTALLIYRKQPKAFYDFSNRESTEPGRADAHARLEWLKAQTDLQYESSRAHGIHFTLTGILHDQAATYLRFRVENHTSVLYQTDFVGFERLRRYRKGFFGKTRLAHFPLEVREAQTQAVLPYATADLFYVLPLQALEEKEAIIATLREQGARRSVALKIPYRMIKKAELY